MARLPILLPAVALLAALAGPATANPLNTYSPRVGLTVIKPDFTRPGGQPGAAREIAPAKPLKRHRRMKPTGATR